MSIFINNYQTAPPNAEVTYYITLNKPCPSDCIKYDALSHSIVISSNNNLDAQQYVVTLHAFLSADSFVEATNITLTVQIFPNTINNPFNPLRQSTATYVVHDPMTLFDITEQQSSPNLPMNYNLLYRREGQTTFQSIVGSSLLSFVNPTVYNKRQL